MTPRRLSREFNWLTAYGDLVEVSVLYMLQSGRFFVRGTRRFWSVERFLNGPKRFNNDASSCDYSMEKRQSRFGREHNTGNIFVKYA